MSKVLGMESENPKRFLAWNHVKVFNSGLLTGLAVGNQTKN